MEEPSVLGVDLLTYPEKFDIALKLGPLRESIRQYQSSSDDITDSLSLKHSQPDFQLSKEIFKGIPRDSLIVSSLVQAEWTKTALLAKQSPIEKTVKKIPNLRKVIDSWKQICGLNLGCLFSAISPESIQTTKDHLNKLFEYIPQSPHFTRALALYNLDRRLIEQHKKLSLECQRWLKSPHPRPKLTMVHMKCPEFNMEIKMGWDVGMVTIGDHHFCLNRDLFLLWVNKLGELACALLYTLSQPQLFMDEGPQKLTKMLLSCCRVMLRKTRSGDWEDQFGYTLPKTLEAIGVGMIIAQEDNRRGWDNQTFLNGTIMGLIEDGIISGDNPKDTEIYQFFSTLTTPEISELIGAAKILGHPDIDLDKGIKKLYTRTHEDIIVDAETVMETRGLLVFEFCQKFFKRTGTWPPVVIPPGQFPRLTGFVNAGTSPLSVDFTTNLNMTYGEWGQIEIDPCIENDFWESPLEFIKDTALSPQRESAWAYCMKNKLHPDETLKTTLRTMNSRNQYSVKSSNRLIIQFLLSDDLYWQSLNYRKKWASYASMDQLEDECSTYWVIKLTPKEREMKIEGRFFGASPAPERDRRIQTEGVLASMMGKMFPEQMLTATELEFNQKLIKFRNYRKLYPNHHVLQLCFDFQAWNNYMRKAFIDAGIGPVLDGIFNTHAYSRVMEFYERALLHCQTPRTISAWLGQLGGIEGLNQATWTLATLAGLKVALGRLGYHFEVSVKGDDCRAAIMIPKEECGLDDLQREADRIKAVLAEYCLNTGMHLKAEETFVSLSLIASSKQYQLDDIILPCGLKQAIKMAHHSNSAFPTSQDILADIMSASHSACFQTPFIIQTWSIGVFVGLLRMNLDHKIFRTWSSSHISAFGLWPQVLGGPGILPLEIFIVRGENDLLSITFSLFKYIFQTSPDETLKQSLWNILCIPDKKIPHWKLLISDPYSLNKDHPITPSQFLKSNVREQIKKVTRNPMLTALMARETLEGDKFLIETLITLRPANVKIMTAVYENSAFAVLDKVLARVDNAASIFALLGAHKGVVRTRQGLNILKKASYLHKKQVQWWMEIITIPPQIREPLLYGRTRDEFSQRCPTVSAQEAREQSWGIPIFGITYPAITQQFSLIPSDHPVTAAFLINVKPQCPTYHMKGSNQIKPQTTHHHPYFSAPEEVNPWIGGKTASKTKLSGYPSLHKSTALPKIEALLELYARVVPICEAIGPVLKWLVRMMVYLTDAEFAILLPSILGGCAAHRVDIESYSMTVTPNFRHNLLQLIIRNYDRMQLTHENLNRDYTLNFAAINIHHSFLLASTILFSDDFVPKTFIAVPHQINDERTPDAFNHCQGCINDVTDRPLQINVGRIPNVDLSESAFVILPKSDVNALRMSLDVLVQQRQINILEALNLNRTGSAQYLRAANQALVNKMMMDARRHIDDLRVTVPGGLLSDSSIEALGIQYSPFPIKFLNWMNPDHVVETIISEVKLELLASYPKEDLMSSNVSTFRHRGLTSHLLPVLKYFTLAASHQALAGAFHLYQARKGLQEPLIGLDIMNPTTFANWVYRIGVREIQSPEPGRHPHHYRIITSHNETQALILQHITPKLDNIRLSALRHIWQRYHGPEGSILGFFQQQSPCDIWCQGEGHIMNWINHVLQGGEGHDLQKSLFRVLLLPISILSSIATPQDLTRHYHSRRPLPALRLGDPNSDVYREESSVFSSLSAFFGFNFEWFITGQCEHHTYDLEQDFLGFVDALIPWWMGERRNLPYQAWLGTWNVRVLEFAEIEVAHMEEEAAMRELMDHPFRVGTILAETQRRMQEPDPLPLLRGIQADIHNRRVPNSLGAVRADIVPLNQIDIPVLIPVRRSWCNWNQHLRIRGLSGSACCKLWEIMFTYRMFRHRNNFGIGVHLADGQGGFTTFIGLTFPNFTVFFNTWQEADATSGGCPGDWIANFPTRERLIWDMTEMGDLCDAGEVTEIIAIIRHKIINQDISILTFDAERYAEEDSGQNLIMLDNVARIIGMVAGGITIVVVKLFWVDWMIRSNLMGYLVDAGRSFRLIKPHSSRETNMEFYLVVRGVEYPFGQYTGSLHLRKAARLRHALINLSQQFNPNPGTKGRRIPNLVHNLWRNLTIPPLSSKQMEITLRLSVGTLSHRVHWVMNAVHHEMDEQLQKARSILARGQIHSVTRGRNPTAVGGVRLVQEATSQVLRLSGAIEVLRLNEGWFRGNPTLPGEWFRDVHSDHWNALLEDKFHREANTLRQSVRWNPCGDHEDCITSEGVVPVWAHLPVHLGLIHEYGTGVDMAVRIITLGFVATNESSVEEVIDSILRS